METGQSGLPYFLFEVRKKQSFLLEQIPFANCVFFISLGVNAVALEEGSELFPDNLIIVHPTHLHDLKMWPMLHHPLGVFELYGLKSQITQPQGLKICQL